MTLILSHMNNAMNLFEKHKTIIDDAVAALAKRTYYTPYPETPKAYAEDGDAKAKAYISAVMNTNFSELLQAPTAKWVGEEVSPFLQTGIGVRYPQVGVEDLVKNGKVALKQWSC